MAVIGFYIVLPSDSSTMYFPENKILRFITKLSCEIILNGEWECGVTEVHYPLVFFNVVGDELSITHSTNTEIQSTLHISPEHYPKGDVVETINKFIFGTEGKCIINIQQTYCENYCENGKANALHESSFTISSDTILNRKTWTGFFSPLKTVRDNVWSMNIRSLTPCLSTAM